MAKYGLSTKKAAVDFALRRAAGPPLGKQFLLDLEGIGWQGDLDEMRGSRVEER
jgi:Arc/MetJ family transcription regulator